MPISKNRLAASRKHNERVGTKKPFGADHSTHHLLEIRHPPDSIVALRNELPMHPDIYMYAQRGKTFEECCGIIAAHLDIVLDGMYDADKLCEVLVESLRNRRMHPNEPWKRHPALHAAEIVERKDTVEVEIVKEGTIAPVKEAKWSNTPDVTIFDEILETGDAIIAAEQQSETSPEKQNQEAEHLPSVSESADLSETSNDDITDLQQKS